MNLKLTIFALPLLFLYSIVANAHGNITPSMAPRHNGQIVTSEETEAHFEIAHSRKNLSLFIYPMAKTDIKNYEFIATLQENGKRTQQNLKISMQSGKYEIEYFKKKGYMIFLQVTNTETRKKDLLRFVF